jgi:hypothetical protein
MYDLNQLKKHYFCVIFALFIALNTMQAQQKKNEIDLIYYYHADTSGFNEYKCSVIFENALREIGDSTKLLVYAPNSININSRQFHSFYDENCLNRLYLHNAEFDLNNVRHYFNYASLDSLCAKLLEIKERNDFKLNRTFIIIDIENINWLFKNDFVILKFLKTIQLLTSGLKNSFIILENSKLNLISYREKIFLNSIFNESTILKQ